MERILVGRWFTSKGGAGSESNRGESQRKQRRLGTKMWFGWKMTGSEVFHDVY
jgi:hypothetical protein